MAYFLDAPQFDECPRQMALTTPTTSEEELAAYGPKVRAELQTDEAEQPVKKLVVKSPRSVMIRLVLMGLSLPLGILALFIGCSISIPPLRKVLLERYLTIYGAILATLVLFLAVTFPRVQASVQLSVIFGSLFVIAFSYFCALLSVIMDTAAGLIIAVVQFLGCWELVGLSMAGVEIEDMIPGKVATYVAFTINYALIVALRPPSKIPIADAAIAGLICIGVAWGFIANAGKIVDKIQEDSQN